jgi:hypothetical protein
VTEKRRYRGSGKRSTEFGGSRDANAKRYLVVAPPGLWQKVTRQAKGRISIRALILGLLARWVAGDIVHPPLTGPCQCELPDPNDEHVCRACSGITP